MGFRMGIVGLPNVGKSTLFNALTKTAAAQAANFPFCTIEPNVGEVSVPDARLDKLAEIHFNRVQALVEVLPKFVEPAMLLILGGCFAFFIIALLGPLYSMISNVGGV